jgi:hypothetical protein
MLTLGNSSSQVAITVSTESLIRSTRSFLLGSRASTGGTVDLMLANRGIRDDDDGSIGYRARYDLLISLLPDRDPFARDSNDILPHCRHDVLGVPAGQRASTRRARRTGRRSRNAKPSISRIRTDLSITQCCRIKIPAPQRRRWRNNH